MNATAQIGSAVVCAGIAIAFAGCGTPSAEKLPEVPEPHGDVTNLPDELALILVKDARQHLQELTPAPTITFIETAMWPRNTLGCRDAALTGDGTMPGYRVRVTAGTLMFEYHTDMQRKFRLCSIRGGRPPVVVDPTSPPVD